MTVYELLCQEECTARFEDFFKLHVFCDGVKTSFRRYKYLQRLIQEQPDESFYHLLIDTSIYFGVSEQTIYADVAKMKFVLC